MALTQVSSEGIKDDAIKDVKIPANAVGNAELKDDAVGVNELSATGTPSSSTFLRGDNTWTAPTSHSIGDGGLTTNDFTNADHTKLDGIEANATADQTGGEIKTLYEEQTNTNAFTDADHTKLDGIATSANNYSHPTTAGNVHVPSGGSSGQVLKYSSAGTAQWGTDNNTTYTAGTGLNLSGTEFSVTSLALTTVQEAANQSAMLGLTTQEGDVVVRTDENKSYVKNAGTAGSMSDFTLLRTPTDAVLSINGNTGAISAAQIASAVEAASDSNTFTDADHTKLNAIEASATADQTGAEIKSAYEGESDTNAFTDADHTKLDGIAAGAEVNVQSDWNSSSGDNQILNKPTLVSALNDLSDVSASSPSADQIIKWNGSAWALATDGGSAAGGVSQNIIVTLSESIDGSRTDFSMSTTPATAQNLTVSINGVIQKPNAGTTISNSSEGYCVSGSTLKFATAPANGSTVFVVAQTAASGGSTDLEFNDNTKAKFGTGGDLQIYHDGTYSHLQNLTGDLLIKNDGTNPIRIRSVYNEENIVCYANGAVELYYDNSKKLYTESSGVAIDGDVSIESNGYIRVRATGDNSSTAIQLGNDGTASFTGVVSPNSHVDMPDNAIIKLGTGDDLEIYHNGANSYLANSTGVLFLMSNGGVQIKDTGGNEVHFKTVDNGAVELYYDNSKKLETASFGLRASDSIYCDEHIVIDNDTGIIKLGTAADLQIYHDGNNSFIKDAGTGRLSIVTSQLQVTNAADSEVMIKATEDGAAELYWGGTNAGKKLETTAGGVTITGTDANDGTIIKGDLRLNKEGETATKIKWDGSDEQLEVFDDVKVSFGDSQDLQIYHDGQDSYVEQTGTGSLYLKNTSNNQHVTAWAHVGGDFRAYVNNGETSIIAAANGLVKLYYDNSKKLETTSGGVDVTGMVQADQFALLDSEKATYGDSNDLQIFFDGTNGYMYAGNDGRSGPVIKVENQGNNNDRDGILIQCGKDDSSGTNVALEVKDGNGTTQGHLLFTNGTLSIDAFTGGHHCIVPDADNPSDDSMAYPYGTLLETIDIEYRKNPDGSSTERGIIYKVQKTQSANSKKVLGAYSGSMNNRPDNGPNMHHVYVLGDGHILVNNAGGNIEVGDGICSSATAGIGQKATANPSMIIGIAQEAITFTGSETKLVAVQYGLQQFIPWT